MRPRPLQQKILAGALLAVAAVCARGAFADSISDGVLVPYVPPPAFAEDKPAAPEAPVATPPAAAEPAPATSDVIYSSVPLPPQKPSHSAIRSKDDRFVVGGMTTAQNYHLTTEIADWAAAIEKRIGQKVPWLGQGQVLGIAVQESAGPATPYRRLQGWESGRFYQRITTPPSSALDDEDLQLALAATLLSRCAAALSHPSRRTGLGPSLPDWISAGVAQSLQAPVAARNREWIAMELDAPNAAPMALADVIRLRSLPPGRWREKAYAHAAVDFLFPASAPADNFRSVLQLAAENIPIDAPFIATAFAPVFRGRDPESAWRTHLERWSRQRPAEARSAAAPLRTGANDYAIEQTLIRALTVRPDEWIDDVPADAPAELSAGDLPTYRDAPWAAPLAIAIRSYLIASRVEASPSLQNVFAAYEAYFDLFRHPPAPEQKTGFFHRRAPDADPLAPVSDEDWLRTLGQLWRRAQTLHQDFLYRKQERTAWIDAVEASYLALHPLERTAADAPRAPAAPAPRTPIHRYVDAFDKP